MTPRARTPLLQLSSVFNKVAVSMKSRPSQQHALAADVPFTDLDKQPTSAPPVGVGMCILSDEGFAALMACPALAVYCEKYVFLPFHAQVLQTYSCNSGALEDCIDGFRQRVSRVPADTIDWSHLQAWRCVITFCAAAQRMQDGDSSRAFALLSAIDSFLAVGCSGGEAWCRVYRVISQMLIGQHYRRLNKTHAACEAYCKAAKLCKSSSNSIMQLLAPCALSESGAALLSIGRAAEAQVALEQAIAQSTDLLGRCVQWREVAQSMCKQAGHYWALDSECWGSLFSEAIGIQTAAAFFNLSLAHAKQSSVKKCCKCMKQCLAVGKLSLPSAHPILHAALRPCEAAQQVPFNDTVFVVFC
jgi:hypothetical protein